MEVTVLCFYLVNGRLSISEQDFTDSASRRLNVSGNPARYVAQVELSSRTEDSVRSVASAVADAILDSLPDPNGRVLASQSAQAHREQEADKQPATRGINEPNALPSPLAQFPRTLNGWTGADVSIPATTQEYMQANFADDFISRRYTDEATGQQAMLYAVYCSSRPGAVLGHQPLRCYPANGWIWDRTAPAFVVPPSNRLFRFVMHRFRNPSTSADVAVLCFYVADGRVVSEEDLLLRFAREPAQNRPRYVAAVQISSVREDSARAAAGAMTDALVETLAITGPSASVVGGAQEQPGVEDAGNGTVSQQPRLAVRRFNSEMAFDVFVRETLSLIPDLERAAMEPQFRSIGHTPSTTPLEIPAGWLWWVQPSVPVQDWDLLIRELDRNGVPGLRLPLATNSDMEHLAGLSGLKYLDLMSSQITDAGLAHLKGLTQLQWLNLLGARVTDAGLVHLKDMTKLEILDLSHTQITGAGIAYLNGLTALQCLSLQDNLITDAGLQDIEGLTKLQFLDLLGTRITDAGLAHLANLPELQALLLGSSKITGPGLAYLKSMPRLRGLVLAGTQVTDAGLAHMASLTGLQGLALSGTQITDAGIAHIKGIIGLRFLELDQTQITNAGLAYLRGLTELRWLDLASDKITDSGLEQIESLTKLEHLNVRGAQITAAGKQQLKQSLPKLVTD